MSVTAAAKVAGRKVLIYRLGSLGDTVVALPCFHLIRRKFPAAEIRVLTNRPISNKAPRLASVLSGSQLVDGYFEYSATERELSALFELARDIKKWHPDTLIYLVSRSSLRDVIRDIVFFLMCGITHVLGLPLSRDRLESRQIGNGLAERECERLARCLSALGDAEVHNPRNWSLQLSEQERKAPLDTINAQFGGAPYIAVCIGTKKAENDWGLENWRRLITALLARYSLPIVFIGGDADREQTDVVAPASSGGFLNLCGRLSVRESAAVLAGASLFVGHDSGPMHLAATAAIPIVAVFGRHSQPGIWFPLGENVRILYPRAQGANISSIRPPDVLEAVDDLLLSAESQFSGNRPSGAQMQ